jgi:cellulose synthase/poly-beta-1,6-N-acetylglucosamine synthase-like glycosyltransferase
MPTICNAANIAYKKSIYDEVGGFTDQLNLSSGDDELLMQKISRDTDFKIKFSIDQRSIVCTSPNESLKEFYQQRKRWASKGLFYRDRVLILKLVLIYLFFIGLAIQLALSIFYDWIFIISLSISLFLKFILEGNILSLGRKIIFRNLSLKYFLISELMHIPYIIILGAVGTLGNYFWKDRKIKR